jgi:hypothetical protein
MMFLRSILEEGVFRNKAVVCEGGMSEFECLRGNLSILGCELTEVYFNTIEGVFI